METNPKRVRSKHPKFHKGGNGTAPEHVAPGPGEAQPQVSPAAEESASLPPSGQLCRRNQTATNPASSPSPPPLPPSSSSSSAPAGADKKNN
ncbi:uncharacterized protein N7487_005539 [Penicillium crustosum]|uniref:uncharacterized protein n=1 Tax=Penicillium crustosum TaxID=36656 RepID=UPI00238A04D0|nr:uncharacterized protein N7487_005539 [Penicillium crustosum]KAJ5411180.1 hypothetical protein N7487_005539 [Penicillium crustosum]